MELLRTENTFQRCTNYVDISGRSSARICRALAHALARLSCSRMHARFKYSSPVVRGALACTTAGPIPIILSLVVIISGEVKLY